MTLHLHERKFELDSLLAFLKLSVEYYRQTKDQSPYDSDWIGVTATVLSMIEQQQADSPGPYFFQRQANEPTDTLLHGVGAPARRTGKPTGYTLCLAILTPAHRDGKEPLPAIGRRIYVSLSGI